MGNLIFVLVHVQNYDFFHTYESVLKKSLKRNLFIQLQKPEYKVHGNILSSYNVHAI